MEKGEGILTGWTLELRRSRGRLGASLVRDRDWEGLSRISLEVEWYSGELDWGDARLTFLAADKVEDILVARGVLEAVRLLAPLASTLTFSVILDNPLVSIDAMLREGAVRVVEDRRLGKTIPIEEVRSIYYRGYEDEPGWLEGQDESLARVLAAVFGGAQARIISGLALLSDGIEKVEAFLAAGCPVVEIDAEAPDVRSLEEMASLE